jgi:hypothetical protein
MRRMSTSDESEHGRRRILYPGRVGILQVISRGEDVREDDSIRVSGARNCPREGQGNTCKGQGYMETISAFG